MANPQKLYQILEKAEIETKIAIEIQDWIIDTIAEKRDQSMNQFEATKLLPIHLEMRNGFESMRSEMASRFETMHTELNTRFETMHTDMITRFERMDFRYESFQKEMDVRFESLQKEMDVRFLRVDEKFTSLEKRLDATNFSIRLLGVPIVGATIGGLGVVFLQIYERLVGL